jgi:hypothetical protein
MYCDDHILIGDGRRFETMASGIVLRRAMDLSQSWHQIVWGLSLIGYFVLLRRCEFLKVDGKWEKCVVLWSGRDTFSEPLHKTKPWEPVSRTRTNHGVLNGHVVQLLKEVATDMGLNAINYSIHSVRIGGSLALLSSGSNTLMIMLLDHWLSDCYQSYPVLTSKGRVGVSNLMCYVLRGVVCGGVNDLFGASLHATPKSEEWFRLRTSHKMKLYVLPHNPLLFIKLSTATGMKATLRKIGAAFHCNTFTGLSTNFRLPS